MTDEPSTPARTRLYRNGVLEAEDFPVADVSDYLAEPDTIVWVDFCAPIEGQLHELAAASSACTSWRSRTRSVRTSDRSSTTTTRTCSCRCHAVRVRTPSDGELDETEIDAFIDSRWMITVRKDEGFPMEPVTAAVGPLTRPGRARRQLPAVRAARRGRRRLLRRGAGLRRLLRRGQRGHLRRATARPRPSSATGSRCAERSCASIAWSCRCARRSAR